MRRVRQPARSTNPLPHVNNRHSTTWTTAMKTNPNHTAQLVNEPTEEQIQHAAYLMWVEEGRPEGRDQDNWFAAKELLCHHHGRNLPNRRGAPEKAKTKK